jgi:hypothetical protein
MAPKLIANPTPSPGLRLLILALRDILTIDQSSMREYEFLNTPGQLIRIFKSAFGQNIDKLDSTFFKIVVKNHQAIGPISELLHLCT